MSGKRQATSDLNHNNWDQEEEPEEAGHFQVANEDELKARVIKKARRRVTDAAAAGTNETKSIFGGFTGFAKTTPTESTNKSSLFSFLNKVPTTTANTGNKEETTAVTPAKAPTTGFSFGILPSGDSKNDEADVTKDEAYYGKIIKLNQSFCAWIKEHVDKQPLCNLMRTFKDYEKYWEQIKQEQPVASISATTSNTTSPSIFGNIKFNALPLTSTTQGTAAIKTNGNDNPNSSVTASSSKLTFEDIKSNGNANTAKVTPFTFGSPGSSSKPKSDIPSGIFSFGAKADDKPTNSAAAVAVASPTKSFSFGLKKDDATATPGAPAPSFSFGLKKDEKTPSTGFSFTPGSAPFSFGDIKPPAAAPDDGGNDDDKYEPPKVEVKEIVEEDAIFTKKCKVFVKENNAYKEFGIGTLYLKSVQDSSKTQLLVRSSNNLGTILVNLLLVEGSVVTQRVGKNNVMIVHPNKDGETQTTLVRVKDGAEADELLEVINNNKK